MRLALAPRAAGWIVLSALAACGGPAPAGDAAADAADATARPDTTVAPDALDATPDAPPDAPVAPDARSDGSLVPPDVPAGRCGNGVVEASEQCDDGNRDDDDECSNTCRARCGNGVVDTGEACDTAIAAGTTGACPAACDDAMPCTADVLAGAACSARCVHGAITAPVPGDMCCPAGATSATDRDCPAMCGNGVVDTGEACDTMIAAGRVGACPTAASCDDGVACTADALAGGGTCAAACTHTPITAAANGDGCCPAGATSATDDDCAPGCGNGVVTAPERCDTMIAAGLPGACPTACSDGVACTRDVLVNAGTCAAACVFPPVTTATSGDGCCPPGATRATDDDCAAACGNRAVEPGETCDDGNTTAGDGCDASCQREATAFRVNALELRDPHTFTSVFGVCTDITRTLNDEVRTIVTRDNPMAPDGYLDLNIVAVFRPLDQTAASGALDVVFPLCTDPLATTRCTRTVTSLVATSTATNQPAAGATCLGLLAGTTSPGAFTPVPTAATGPCFVSDEETLRVSLAGTNVTLRSARIAATYVGAPASQLVNGLIRGFLSEADADATMIPMTVPLVGGRPLSNVLPGGGGNCRTGVAGARDMGPDGTTPGWWFYLNFTAVPVPYSDR